MPKSVPKSCALNKMDLAQMFFCVTAGKQEAVLV